MPETKFSSDPTPLPVHPATAADLDSVLDLLSRQFREHAIKVTDEQLLFAVAAMLADPGLGFFLLAKNGEEAVGLACVSFCWTLEHGGKSAWLDELYVLPEFRSQGIGGELIETVLETAQSRGCAAVDIEVELEHRRAEGLYRRYGFEPLPRSRWVKSLEGTASKE